MLVKILCEYWTHIPPVYHADVMLVFRASDLANIKTPGEAQRAVDYKHNLIGWSEDLAACYDVLGAWVRGPGILVCDKIKYRDSGAPEDK